MAAVATTAAIPLLELDSDSGETFPVDNPATGETIAQVPRMGVKKVSLELGGNAPFIVFDDADLDEAVAGTLICKFRNSGQTCISANRILVQDGIFDAFVSRLVDEAAKLKVGNGLEPETMVGPLIEQSAVDKVQR